MTSVQVPPHRGVACQRQADLLGGHAHRRRDRDARGYQVDGANRPVAPQSVENEAPILAAQPLDHPQPLYVYVLDDERFVQCAVVGDVHGIPPRLPDRALRGESLTAHVYEARLNRLVHRAAFGAGLTPRSGADSKATGQFRDSGRWR